MADPVPLTISAGRIRWGTLVTLFQQGVLVPIPGPRPVSDFLALDLGIDPDYIRRTIATVFVDSMVVDDLDTATLRPGSVLTLSAAMPGLAGATLRRSGYYRAMRADVSWRDDGQHMPDAVGVQRGAVVVKLFNLLIPDVGPLVLRHGILLAGAEATRILGPDPVPGLEGTAPDCDVLLKVVL